MAFQSETLVVLAAELPLVGDHLGAAELRDLLVSVARFPAAATGPWVGAAVGLAGRERAQDRELTHLLHAAGDDEVRRAAHDGLGGEMYGLLGRSALAVDGDTGHRLRKAGCECRCAGDVAGLGTDVVQTAEDDVIDRGGVHVVSTDDGLDDMRGHVGRMFGGESAVSLADGGADCVDDEGFGHAENLT